MDELRPCPFCGSEAHTYHNNLWHVSCDNPKGYCVMGFGAFLTEEEAVAAWNGRAKPVYAKVKLPKETQEHIEQMVHDEVSKWLKELNIIRCKDCKHEFEEWGHPYCCRIPTKAFEVNGDSFCSFAEPREEA